MIDLKGSIALMLTIDGVYAISGARGADLKGYKISATREDLPYVSLVVPILLTDNQPAPTIGDTLTLSAVWGPWTDEPLPEDEEPESP